GIARDAEQRSAVTHEVLQPLHEPRRRPVELVLGRARDLRAADALIGVEHVHERRSGAVRLPCHPPREGCLLEERVDREDLAGLDVETDAHREARVIGQAVIPRRHGGESRLSSWPGSVSFCSSSLRSSLPVAARRRPTRRRRPVLASRRAAPRSSLRRRPTSSRPPPAAPSRRISATTSSRSSSGPTRPAARISPTRTRSSRSRTYAAACPTCSGATATS